MLGPSTAVAMVQLSETQVWDLRAIRIFQIPESICVTWVVSYYSCAAKSSVALHRNLFG